MKFLRAVAYVAWVAFCLAAFARRDLASPRSLLAATIVGAALCWQAVWRFRAPAGDGLRWQASLPTRPWSRQTWCAIVALSLFLLIQGLDLLNGQLRSAFGILLGLNTAIGLLFLSAKVGSRAAEV